MKYCDQAKKQVIVLEDGKPLFVWDCPKPDYIDIDEALSAYYSGADVSIVAMPALIAGAGGWMGSIGEVNGGIGKMSNVVHVYQVIALPIVSIDRSVAFEPVTKPITGSKKFSIGA